MTVPDRTYLEAEDPVDETAGNVRHKPRLWGRVMIVIRRVHLYAGLFLLPWVFLYGVTGAMFNHQELLPEVDFQQLDAEVLADSPMKDFPAPEKLAEQVVAQLQSAAGGSTIALASEPGAEYTNNILFEVDQDDTKYIVHIDPLTHSSKVVTREENPHQPERLLKDLRNIKLSPDPHEAAQQSAAVVLETAGIETKNALKPLGWTKLNFLAEVDGEPARVTYVLKDGHVDVMKYEGHHGMSPRQFFLRLHTSHGQPPHWNGRMIWTFAIDAMAISMVVWGCSGLLMWWQIKRTRLIGSLVIGASLVTAIAMYFSMHHFYATTML